MTTDFAETYRRKSSDELLRLVSEKNSLQDAARRALDAEMEKRGLGEGAAARFEKQEHEETERAAEYANADRQVRRKWFWNLLRCLGIFGAAAILTIVMAEYVLKLPSEAVRLLTLMSLKLALALAVLASAFGSRWLTIKRTVIAAAIFSVVLFAWIVWTVEVKA
jgi:hypothetical protein